MSGQGGGLSSPVNLPVRWVCQPFQALTVQHLYALLQLRSQVFVVEQACVFQDLDGADADCVHLMALNAQEQVLAAVRLVPAGLKFAEASIGRVVTAPEARATGLGHALMQRAVTELHTLWGVQPIRIGAQAHLQGFYARHGFETVGEPYMEDGIPHVEMLRR